MSHSKSRRLIVMTGGTTGFGLYAAHHLADQPDTRLLIGAAQGVSVVPPGAELLDLDLTSLDSVRHFAATVRRKIGDAPIDILVLNAYVQNSGADTRSADGYEMMFAVNHLAHYLLVRLLMPRMSRGGRLVILCSGMHDPRLSPAAPKAIDAATLASADVRGFGAGMRAYAASKTCNLLTAQYIARLDDTRSRQIGVVAFNPGLAGDGAPTSHRSTARRVGMLLVRGLVRAAGIFRPEFIVGTPERSGQLLADVCLGVLRPPPGGIYISQVKGQATFPAPAALTRSPAVQDDLWRQSAVLIDAVSPGTLRPMTDGEP